MQIISFVDEMRIAPFMLLIIIIFAIITLIHEGGSLFTENFTEEETASAIEKQITQSLSPESPEVAAMEVTPTVTVTPLPMEMVQGLEDTVDDLEDQLAQHTHADFTDIQKDLIQKQMQPAFDGLDTRMDVSEKTREGIIKVLKDSVPKYVRKYVEEENKRQHEALVKHIEKTVANMNAATTAGLNSVKDRMETHIRDKSYEIEDRVSRNTERQIKAALKTSSALSQKN